MARKHTRSPMSAWGEGGEEQRSASGLHDREKSVKEGEKEKKKEEGGGPTRAKCKI